MCALYCCLQGTGRSKDAVFKKASSLVAAYLERMTSNSEVVPDLFGNRPRGGSYVSYRECVLIGTLPEIEHWCNHLLKCSALNAAVNIAQALHTVLTVTWT